MKLILKVVDKQNLKREKCLEIGGGKKMHKLILLLLSLLL